MDQTALATNDAIAVDDNDVSYAAVERKSPLTTLVSGRQEGWLMGLEPTTPRSTIKRQSNASRADKELATSLPAVCTPVCTSNSENAHGDCTDNQRQHDNLKSLAAELIEPLAGRSREAHELDSQLLDDPFDQLDTTHEPAANDVGRQSLPHES